MNRLSAETADPPSARVQTIAAEAPTVASNLARGYLEERASKVDRYRFLAVASPAMTGATTAWATCIAGLHAIGSGGLGWLPIFDDLIVIWLLTVGFSFSASRLRRMPPLWAAIVTTLMSCTAGLANSYANHQFERYRTFPWPELRPSHSTLFFRDLPTIFAIVALSGVIWIPLLYLSSLRHRTLAESQGGAKPNA